MKDNRRSFLKKIGFSMAGAALFGGLQPFSSVIASPYRDQEGRVVGVLGVIGPTRLNYARVVPMVDLTARSLSKSLGRSLGKLIA